MNIYTSILDYISKLPVVEAWSDVKSLLDHAEAMQPRDWQLPLISCQAMGGSEEDAIPACAAIACAQVGIILIDDLLDDDPRGAYHQLGVGQTANYAAALLSSALQAIHHSSAPPAVKLAAVQGLNQMITTIAFGQYLDAQNPTNEAGYWRVVQSKSGPFFRTALELGAFFGGTSEKNLNDIGKIGYLYGEMIQIHDDLHDCMTEPAGPDWIQGRASLPILFAQTVDHPERVHFLELSKRISDTESLHEAQSILIRCGSVSYCIHQLLSRYQTATRLLREMNLVMPDTINKLLDDLVIPVYRLLESNGMYRTEFPSLVKYLEIGE